MIDYHRELLGDERRTHAYREAIRRVVRPGDIVLDIGCGSGVLSFFACQAGASRVFALEKGHIADAATMLVRHLGLADRVTVLHEESTKVDLPTPVDVLVTETMGALGLDEYILGYVLDARRRLLRPGAAIVPHRLVLTFVPVELPAAHDRHIASWSRRPYGLDLAPLGVFASNVVYSVDISGETHLATPADLIEIDLTSFEETLVRGRASFDAVRNADLHGFGLWFTATLADDITLSNREPRQTHWGQAFLPLEQPIPIPRGATIHLDVETDDGKHWRWRGKAGTAAFDQTTWLSMPPCSREGKGKDEG
jgi:enediyne biosynthesis protein CalE3